MSRNEVQLLSWPSQRLQRDWCRDRHIPRVLVVEAGQTPPVVTDLLEDWVRTPLAPADLRFRVRSLAARYEQYNRPHLDPDHYLVFRGRRVSPSPAQAILVTLLVEDYGRPVERASLARGLGQGADVDRERRNTLDVHIGRLRNRVQRIGLTIRAVWGHGYALEPLDGDLPAELSAPLERAL